MPYYQIEHLDALEAYFELLGIEKIYDLPRVAPSDVDSTGPVDNISTPAITSQESSPDTPTSPIALHSLFLSAMPIDHSALAHLNLTQLPDDLFTLNNPDNASHSISATAQDVCSYIDYDRKIRDGNLTAAEPAGYDTFTSFFNSPAGSCAIKFSVIDQKTMTSSTDGVAPTYKLFKVDSRNTKQSAHMTTGSHTPWNASPIPAPTHGAGYTPSIQFHSDGSTTYSSQEQATIAHLSLHAATQFLKGKDAAEVHHAKCHSPYCATPSPAPAHASNKCRHAHTPLQSTVPTSTSAAASATPHCEMDDMEIDNDALISDMESPEVLVVITSSLSLSKAVPKATKAVSAKEGVEEN
jgi:hypothetical protein